jgi:hypothetical protein
MEQINPCSKHGTSVYDPPCSAPMVRCTTFHRVIDGLTGFPGGKMKKSEWFIRQEMWAVPEVPFKKTHP